MATGLPTGQGPAPRLKPMKLIHHHHFPYALWVAAGAHARQLGAAGHVVLARARARALRKIRDDGGWKDGRALRASTIAVPNWLGARRAAASKVGPGFGRPSSTTRRLMLRGGCHRVVSVLPW